MKNRYVIWTLLLLVLAACVKKEDMPGGDLFDQQAALIKIDGTSQTQASTSNASAISATREDDNSTKDVSFSAKLAKENNQDVELRMYFDTAAAKLYNQVYEKTYELLPGDMVEFTNTLKIAKGSITSDKGELKIKVSSKIKENVVYIVALTSSVVTQGVGMIYGTQTLIYTIQKSQDKIKKSLPLTRDLYMEIDGNTSVNNIGNTFTMEGLVYVDKFRGPGDGGDAGITTFMGTEGGVLLRFGDAGVNPDHLQANGTDIGVKFRTKQWYHIALVVSGGKSTAYVNGVKVADISKGGSLGTFFIGRSWNDNRGMPGKIAEIRLWKTARTAGEIQDGMYGVDKNSAGLYAYWKMNEVKDNKIEDVSGNGKDLILMGQSGLDGRQTIKLADEDGINVKQ